MSQDERNLDLLATFHYVAGGMVLLCGCAPILHVMVGLAMATGAMPSDSRGQPPPPFFGWLFVILGITAILSMWTIGIAMAIGGWLLQRRRGYIVCILVAALACMWMPLGTILGVFTLIVLSRASVRELFPRGSKAPAPLSKPS